MRSIFRFSCLLIVLLLFVGCGGMQSFKVVKEVTPKTEGFISPDILQVVGVGYANPKETDSKKYYVQSLKAATINARMRVIDYLLSGLQTDNQEKYRSFVMKVGRFSIERYDPIYGEELDKGSYRADGILELLGLKGFVANTAYEKNGFKCRVIYKVAKAGLLDLARNGFGF